MNKFFRSEKGETNMVSLIVLIGVIVVAVVIFRPYIGQFFNWIVGLFS